MMYSPLLPDIAVRCTPASALIAVMVTPASPAPVEADTRPATTPVDDCAASGSRHSTSPSSTSAMRTVPSGKPEAGSVIVMNVRAGRHSTPGGFADELSSHRDGYRL